jgi:ketosteroid isomerase-like protein
MTQEIEQTIRAVMAAVSRADWDAVLSYTTPDCNFDTTRDLNDVRGFYETHEEVKGALQRFNDAWESWRIEITEFVHVDDATVITRQIGRMRGRGGIEVTTRTSSVWRFRDGMISELVHYREEDDAEKAIGLSE